MAVDPQDPRQRARGHALTAGGDDRPGALLTRPWFWALFVALAFSIPLIKALGSELPDPLPGMDGTPIDLLLRDELGRDVRLAGLRGTLVLLGALPLANAAERDHVFDELRRLRKRLRGLSSAVHWVVLCHGGTAEALATLLDERKAHKPVNHFLVDEHGAEFRRLTDAAGSAGAAWLLLDRHGRVRGVYGQTPAELDRLVEQAGQLANWAGQDPPSGR